jgi:Domain of unknown function (DUF4337)
MSDEITENIEHAHERGEKGIGLTTAICAVFLAVATLMGHRAHTEEVKLQTQVNDQWGFYQAKHSRAHQYGQQAEVLTLQPNGHDLALKYLKISTDEECGVPAEPKDCASPLLKGSPALQQLLAEAKSHKAEKGASDVKPEPAAGIKSETAAGAQSEPVADAKPEHGAEKHSSKPEEKSGKTGKEGGGGVKEGAVKVQERAKEMEAETQLIEHRANYYDAAELFLEISIVLCSIALLSAMKMYWRLSFISTAIGIVAVIWGYVLR